MSSEITKNWTPHVQSFSLMYKTMLYRQNKILTFFVTLRHQVVSKNSETNFIEFLSFKAFHWCIKLCSKAEIKFWPFPPPSATRSRFSKISTSNSAFLGSITLEPTKSRCFLNLKFSEIFHFSGTFPKLSSTTRWRFCKFEKKIYFIRSGSSILVEGNN